MTEKVFLTYRDAGQTTGVDGVFTDFNSALNAIKLRLHKPLNQTVSQEYLHNHGYASKVFKVLTPGRTDYYIIEAEPQQVLIKATE